MDEELKTFQGSNRPYHPKENGADESVKEKGIRLLKKGKKGISHLVFGRIGIVAILFFFQIYLLAYVYRILEKYVPHFFTFTSIFTVFMIIIIVNDDFDPTSKITWLLLTMLSPFPVTLLYLFTRTDLGHRMLKKRIALLRDIGKQILEKDGKALEDIKVLDKQMFQLCKYINRSGNYPIYRNTKLVYFSSGEEMFERLVFELKKAEKYIYLEYFIIEEGSMWGQILEILIEKALKGLDVRVIYDGTCEFTTLPFDYPRKLREYKIKCKVFSALTPFISTHYNNRDHRKIVIVDGNTAFNGGINLADEYINLKKRFGHWKDNAIMLKGEAVKSFEMMFLEIWHIFGDRENVNRKRRISEDEIMHLDYDPKSGCKEDSQSFVMPYGDSPMDNERVGEMVYMDMLNRAKDYVYIFTPYLILDAELETAIRFAAARGVHIKIILPGIPDKKIPYYLAKTYFLRLLTSGVKIYLYTEGFLHSKTFLCDDERAVVGTINLDYRSLYHHFECATYIYRDPCIPDIKQDFMKTLHQCREVEVEDCYREGLAVRMIGSVAKAIASLL